MNDGLRKGTFAQELAGELPQITLSQLPEATEIKDDAVQQIVQDNANYKVSVGTLYNVFSGLPPKREVTLDLQASLLEAETRTDFNIDLTTLGMDVTHVNLVNARNASRFYLENIFQTNIRVIKYKSTGIVTSFSDKRSAVISVIGTQYLNPYTPYDWIEMTKQITLQGQTINVLLYDGEYCYYLDITEYRLTGNIYNYELFYLEDLRGIFDDTGVFVGTSAIDPSSILLTSINIDNDGYIEEAPKLSITEGDNTLYDMSHHAYPFIQLQHQEQTTLDLSAIDKHFLNILLSSLVVQEDGFGGTVYDMLNGFFKANATSLDFKIENEANAGKMFLGTGERAISIFAKYRYYKNNGQYPLIIT